MAFPTTIPAKEITQIIPVALKYSFFKIYKREKPGKIPKNPSKNGNMTIPATAKLLNCQTIRK